MIRKLGIIGACVTICAALTSGFEVIAQEATTQSSNQVMEEILVTARQRKENIQDVPLAVTNLAGDLLEVAYTESVVDIEKFLPNVDLDHTQVAGGGLVASIRGIGFDDNRKTFEPTVGVSLDGVFLGSNAGAAMESFDVESIQVLRGPQGTLFGRNTTGGSIVITRTRPTGEFGVRGKIMYGDYDRLEQKVIVNLPKIADTISTKLYAFKKDSEQFAKTAGTGERKDEEDALFVGAAFLFEPSDKFEALLSIDYVDDEEQPVAAINPTPRGFGYVFCDVLTGILFAGTPYEENACRSQSLEFAEAADFGSVNYPFTNENHMDGISVTLKAIWELSDTMTLTSITGFRDHSEHTAGNVVGDPGIPIGPGGSLLMISEFGQDTDFKQFSQELRLNVTWNQLDLVGGLYYFNSEFDFFPGFLPAHGFVCTQTSFGACGRQQNSSQEVDAYAAFFDGTYRINDRMRFSAGLRISHEEKEFSNALEVGFRAPSTGPFDVSDSESWTEPSWRIALDYDLTNDVMGYVSWARGYRSGGFNARALSEAESVATYDPETVDTFELGARMEFANGRIRVNPTLFYTEYQDKQEIVLKSAGGTSAITTSVVDNASEVEYFGLEVEVDARISENLTVRATLGYLDSEITEFLIQDPSTTTPTLIDDSDNRLIRNAPEKNFSVSFDYTVPLSNSGDLRLFGMYSWKDDMFTEGVKDGIPEFELDGVESYGSADFSLTYTHNTNSGTVYAVSAFIQDAFNDEDGRVTYQRNIAGVFAFGFMQPTKLWGVELSAEF